MNKEHYVIMNGNLFLKEFTEDKEPVFSHFDARVFDNIKEVKDFNKIAQGVILEINKTSYID